MFGRRLSASPLMDSCRSAAAVLLSVRMQFKAESCGVPQLVCFSSSSSTSSFGAFQRSSHTDVGGVLLIIMELRN